MISIILPVLILFMSAWSSCVDFHPIRKSAKKNTIHHGYIEMPSKSDDYEPGKKYKEPDYKNLYDFLDVESFRNEIKEIQDQQILIESKKSWYRKFITLLSPFTIGEKD